MKKIVTMPKPGHLGPGRRKPNLKEGGGLLMREELKSRIREMLRIGGGRLYDHHWQELLLMAMRGGATDPMAEVKAAVAEATAE